MKPINRRGLLFGACSLLAAPAIVRAASLMPVKAIVLPDPAIVSELGYALYPGELCLDAGLDVNYWIKLEAECLGQIGNQLLDTEFPRRGLVVGTDLPDGVPHRAEVPLHGIQRYDRMLIDECDLVRDHLGRVIGTSDRGLGIGVVELDGHDLIAP